MGRLTQARRDVRHRGVATYMSGFECQPYSIQGDGKGLKDKRSKTLKSTFKFIKLYRPRMFILENVCGFVSGKHKETHTKLMTRLKKMKKYRLAEKGVASRDACRCSNSETLVLHLISQKHEKASKVFLAA